jgi:hypothetical protein
MTKICIDCKKRKPLEEGFYFNAKGRPGSYCKRCASNRSLRWQKENPEKYAAARKKWEENNPNYWKVTGL